MSGKMIHMVLIVFLTGLARFQPVMAQQFSESEVKAAFLINFTKFTEWPSTAFASDTSSIIIGFLGESPLASITAKLSAGTRVGKRAVRVKEFSTAKEAADCHVLYISPTEKYNLQGILEALSGKPILTVGELENFCKEQGMINFTRKKSKFGLEINVNSAKKCGLKISSKLLGLATIIE